MAENRVTEQLPLIITQRTNEEKCRLRRFSVLSTLVHVTALTLLMAWTTGRTKVIPPVQVISVDLSHLELPIQQAQPRQFQQRTRTVSVRLPAPAEQVRPAPVPAPSPATAQSQLGKSSAAETLAKTSAPVSAGAAGLQGTSTVAPSSKESATTGQPGPASPVLPATTQSLPKVLAASRPVESANIRVNYMQNCRGLIERHKEYPVMARRGRTEGTVVIRGTLARSGSLRECIVNRSSGSNLLDNAALRAVRSVGQFPPVPLELQSGDLVFELPISFRLSAE